MADITVTEANVRVKAGDVQTSVVQAGEAIARGQSVYLSSNKYYLADNSVDLATAAAVGVSLTSCVTNGYFVIVTKGDMDVGATLVVGEVYIVTDTAGGIGPIGDVLTTQFTTPLGHAKDAATLEVNPIAYVTARA